MNVNCGQDNLLFDYAAGRLAAEVRQQVDEHLAVCPHCRRILASMRMLAQDVSELELYTRHDLSEEASETVLEEAGRLLDERRRRGGGSMAVIRRRARRKQRYAIVRRMLIPLAAAAAVVVAYLWMTRATQQPMAPYPAVWDLAYQANSIQTLEDINRLEPSARRAMDEAMLTPLPDAATVADLELIHYITLRATEPQQLQDIRFLLALVQANERQSQRAALASDVWDRLAALEKTARASAQADGEWPAETRALLASGRYTELYQALVASPATRGRALTAYAAIRAGRLVDARALLDALTQAEYTEAHLAELLRAELAMMQAQFELAKRHFEVAAENDSRLWFQAAYLCKYELHDDKQAGQLFERTGDDRVATYVAWRFHSDMREARSDGDMLLEDFESYPAGSVPGNWKLIPTHAGEFEIARVDDSNVLKQNELGFEGAKLMTGYPGWGNYTFKFDFKVLRRAASPDLQIVVYDQGLSDYTIGLDGSSVQLLHKAMSGADSMVMQPAEAKASLGESFASGKWWRCEIRAQNLAGQQTEVSARLWLRDGPEPQKPQIVWTDRGAPGRPALARGRMGFRVANAEVAFDNVTVTANDVIDAARSGGVKADGR